MSDGAALGAVRDELATGEVTGPRDLAERLAGRGIDLEPEAIRAALRSLGAIRVEAADGPVLAVPVNRDAVGSGPGASQAPGLRAAVAADADWPIQVAVAAVVGVLLLVAFLGWLISP